MQYAQSLSKFVLAIWPTIMNKSGWDKRISHICHKCLDLQAGKEYLHVIPPLPCSMLFLGVFHSPSFVLTTQQHWHGGGGLKTLVIVPWISINFVKCLNSIVNDCLSVLEISGCPRQLKFRSGNQLALTSIGSEHMFFQSNLCRWLINICLIKKPIAVLKNSWPNKNIQLQIPLLFWKPICDLVLTIPVILTLVVFPPLPPADHSTWHKINRWMIIFIYNK